MKRSLSQTPSLGIFDAVISGAGLLGGLLALRLTQHHFRVALVEKSAQPPTGKGRAFALNHGAVRLLSELKLWKALEKDASPMNEVVVSRSKGGPTLTFDPDLLGCEVTGFIVREGRLRGIIHAALQKASRKGLKLLRPNEVVTHAHTSSSLRLSLKSDDVLEAALWVGAEGRHSSLKQHVSLGQTQRHYGQHALVFDVAHTEANQGRAFEHFTPDGPLAFLPLQGKKSAVVWSLTSDLAYALKKHPQALLHALIQHFGWGLGALTLEGEIASYPLSLEMPWQTVSPRCVLVGDAAHAIHPVAGQGLNVGLRDIVQLVEHLQKTKERGLDIGSLTTLQAYDQQRKKDRWSMAAITHALVRGFERPALRKPAAIAWDVSVGVIKAFPVLKRRVMRHAMGLDAS